MSSLIVSGIAALAAILSYSTLKARPKAESIDDSNSFTIQVGIMQEGAARIAGIGVTDFTVDPSMSWDIYPGAQVAEIPTGNEFRINVSAVNDGEDDTLFIRILDDTGTELYYDEDPVIAGDSMSAVTVRIPMPARNYGIIVEVGHIV